MPNSKTSKAAKKTEKKCKTREIKIEDCPKKGKYFEIGRTVVRNTFNGNETFSM